MRDTGLVCNRCGYDPSWEEAQDGSCPGCSESDRLDKPIEMAKINALPLGGVVDVVESTIIYPTCAWRDEDSRSEDPSRKTWWTNRTLARFLCVEIKPTGERLFRSVEGTSVHEARDCFGVTRVLKWRFSQMVLTSPWEPREIWDAKGLYGWYSLKRTYGAWLEINDNLPTEQDKAKARFEAHYGI